MKGKGSGGGKGKPASSKGAESSKEQKSSAKDKDAASDGASSVSTTAAKRDTAAISLPTFDNHRAGLYPTFSTVVQRAGDATVANDDVDRLKAEMELMLSVVVHRCQQLDKQIVQLQSFTDKKSIVVKQPKKKSDSAVDSPKRKDGSSGKPSLNLMKRLKLEAPPPITPPSVDAGQPSLHSPTSLMSDHVDSFWTYVDRFSPSITDDHLKSLEMLISQHSPPSLRTFLRRPVRPPAGRHSSNARPVAATNAGSCRTARASCDSDSPGHDNGTDGDGQTSPQTATDNFYEQSPFGPLTQRLVASLLEENVYSKLDAHRLVAPQSPDDDDAADPIGSASSNQLSALVGSTGVEMLENRVRCELANLGLLLDDEIPDWTNRLSPAAPLIGYSDRSSPPADGDIISNGLSELDACNESKLIELERLQAELQQACGTNCEQLEKLAEAGRRRQRAEAARATVDDADKRLGDAYDRCVKRQQRTVTASVQFNRKDRELIAKLLDERRQLAADYERLLMPTTLC